MSSFNATKCHHIKTSGVRCGSPALRSRRYCYFHQRSRPVLLNVGRSDNDPEYFSLPLFEDAHALQSALRQVTLYYLNGTFTEKKTGLMLYALQIASCNLKLMQAESPKPGEVVTDVPQLSEIPRPEPLPEPAPLNSHTTRMTRFPETPSASDEYQDDIKRQARELREQFAEQLLTPPNNSPQSKNAKHKSSKLPPGAIHACAESAGNEEESQYLN